MTEFTRAAPRQRTHPLLNNAGSCQHPQMRRMAASEAINVRLHQRSHRTDFVDSPEFPTYSERPYTRQSDAPQVSPPPKATIITRWPEPSVMRPARTSSSRQSGTLAATVLPRRSMFT